MRKLNLQIMLLAMSMVVISCAKDDESLKCEEYQNGTIARNGDTDCAKYELRRYSGGVDEEYIEIDALGQHYSGSITISLTDRLLTEGVYTMENNEFYFGFGQLNGRTSNTLTITALDRENKTISGKLEFIGTGAADFQEFEANYKGEFTDVQFIK